MDRRQAEKLSNPEVFECPPPEGRRKQFESRRQALIFMARDALSKAVQYRDFFVGCAVLAWHPELGWQEYSAFNIKIEEERRPGEPKQCAERQALDIARMNGCTKIAGLVTVSKEVSTDRAKKDGVLYPCRECCEMFEESDLVDGDTIVYNAHDDNPPDNQTSRRTIDILKGKALPPNNASIGPAPDYMIDQKRYNYAIMAEERTMRDLLEKLKAEYRIK